MATMSDSSIALKPVIDDPSKPMPSTSAPSISAGVTANDLRCPSRSVNQNRTCSTCSSRIFLRTARRDATLDVARSFDLTIVERLAAPVLLALAIDVLLPENVKSPGHGSSAPEAPLPRKTSTRLPGRAAPRRPLVLTPVHGAPA